MGLHAENLLEGILARELPTCEEFEEFLRAREPEGQRLEYKRDGWLNGKKSKAAVPGHPTKPGEVLRKWVAGFANSVGGLLVLGVDAEDEWQPYRITGMSGPTRADSLRDWCLRALQPIAGLLPAPIVVVVPCSEGEVVLVAVSRARNLVYCVESGSMVYYLRFGESTVRAPDYHIAGLVHGRRERPVFGLLDAWVVRNDDKYDVHLSISNTSMVWAPQIQVGMVVLCRGAHRILPVSDELRYNVVRFNSDLWAELDLVHAATDLPARLNGSGLAPFETKTWVSHGLTLPSLEGAAEESVIWSLATYVVSVNAPPTWFALQTIVIPGYRGRLETSAQDVGDGPAEIGFRRAGTCQRK